MKRREQSGYTTELLANDHLSSTQFLTNHNRNGNLDRGLASAYQPPVLHDEFNDNPDETRDYLYRNTPNAPSLRRSIVPQTPNRTVGANNSNAIDLGSSSLFSYGCFCFQCVRTTEVGIVENCGKFETLLDPGLHIMCWPCSDVSGRLSLKIQQLDITCETRTHDSVFCMVVVTILYQVIPEKTYDAFYRLTNPKDQIKSYIFDIMRSTIPKLSLDEVFTNKSKISKDIHDYMKDVMEDYGYVILNALVTDIRPTQSVVNSMNEINASKRLKTAAVYKAEAEKIAIVKRAEAHAESLYLSGVGVARERNALADGYKETLNSARNKKEEDSARDLLLMTQYLDMLTCVSKPSNSSGQDLILNFDIGHAMDLKRQLKST